MIVITSGSKTRFAPSTVGCWMQNTSQIKIVGTILKKGRDVRIFHVLYCWPKATGNRSVPHGRTRARGCVGGCSPAPLLPGRPGRGITFFILYPTHKPLACMYGRAHLATETETTPLKGMWPVSAVEFAPQGGVPRSIRAGSLGRPAGGRQQWLPLHRSGCNPTPCLYVACRWQTAMVAPSSVRMQPKTMFVCIICLSQYLLHIELFFCFFWGGLVDSSAPWIRVKRVSVLA